MLAIRKDKDLYRLNAYRLMLFMSYFDTAQLVVHAITGVFNAFQTTFNHTFAKLLGCVATPSYITYAVMTIILSLNRLTQLCFPTLDKRLFSKKTMKFWYGIGLLFFATFSLALASPFATIIYFPEYWSWDYDRENYSWSVYVQKVEMIIEIGGIPISGLIYFYVFCVLITKRRKFTKSKNYRAELKVLIQAVIITIYCSILNIFWHNYQVLLPATNLAWSLLNFMWIINAAVNPVIYYIVNATIRKNSRFKSSATDAITMITKTPMFAKAVTTSTIMSKAKPFFGQKRVVFLN
uniref:7TM GPCR serpentine receptor class x (Srx) domain-containing protein n=1 Tax=Panagrolaimus sp. JU765 TaxID=591449 RepID=A0AC34QL84_9BILA